MSLMKPLVSILIPAFNAQEYIADTLRSAVGQTWEKKEIIVLDDGSIDQTGSIAEQFASEHVSVVRQANQGAAGTRNDLLRLCQGDYIQWLDADDLLAHDKVAKQMEALERHGHNERRLLSSAWGYFRYRPRKAEFHKTQLWCDLSPLEWLLRKMESNLHMQTATWLVSRRLTEAAGPWDTRLLGDDDGEYFARVIMGSDGIRFIPEAKMYYRTTGSVRLSHIGRSDRKMEAQFLSMRLNIDYIRSIKDDERVRRACVTYLQTWSSHFYPARPDIFKEAERLAILLGGRLEMPGLRWKYAWITPVFGLARAKQAQFVLPQLKESVIRRWDKLQYYIENSVLGRC
jgi:glycosyltransferase involved in cell wall biosynthesis